MLHSSHTLSQCQEAISGAVGIDVLATVQEALIYERLAQTAGERSWDEMEAWAHISNSYVRSQLFMVERQTTEYPREVNLMEVIKFAACNTQEFNQLGAAGDSRPEVTDLQRVAIGHFTAGEGAEDRRRLERVRMEVFDLGRSQPDYDRTAFMDRCQMQETDESACRLPVYPELRAAIDALFDMWLKYVQILEGRKYTHADLWPEPDFERIVEPLVGDWRSRAIVS